MMMIDQSASEVKISKAHMISRSSWVVNLQSGFYVRHITYRHIMTTFVETEPNMTLIWKLYK